MILVNGETVWMSFAIFDHREGPRSWVTEYVVIDAENEIIRNVGTGRATAMSPFSPEEPHKTAAEAWARAAEVFAEGAVNLTAAAGDCAKRSTELAVKTEVAV